MQDAIDKVTQFHIALGYPVGSTLAQEVEDVNVGSQYDLQHVRKVLANLAAEILPDALDDVECGDRRLYRMHLMIEELGEVAGGLLEADEVKTADGLADLSYTVFGTAVTLSIPLVAVFDEVHRSNMTKMRKGSDYRARDKGAQYERPNIAGAIAAGRKEAK